MAEHRMNLQLSERPAISTANVTLLGTMGALMDEQVSQRDWRLLAQRKSVAP
jgi:hypothetical protein